MKKQILGDKPVNNVQIDPINKQQRYDRKTKRDDVSE